MNDENELTYRGPGPFHLPVVQRATATGNPANGVSMHLFVVLPGRGQQPETVSAQMISSVARELAVRLLQAADKADGKQK